MVFISCEDALAKTHHPDEIQGDKATGDAQEDTGRKALDRPFTIKMERKQGRIATNDIRKTSSRDTRYQDRQKRRHGHINHKHLKGKDQSGYRSLEDARDGTSRTTANKCHQSLSVEME